MFSEMAACWLDVQLVGCFLLLKNCHDSSTTNQGSAISQAQSLVFSFSYDQLWGDAVCVVCAVCALLWSVMWVQAPVVQRSPADQQVIHGLCAIFRDFETVFRNKGLFGELVNCLDRFKWKRMEWGVEDGCTSFPPSALCMAGTCSGDMLTWIKIFPKSYLQERGAI